MIRDLENLNGSTEQDFLAVGAKLMEFRSAARQIASDTATLTELISGEQGRNASDALARMLEHAKEIDAGIELSGQALGEVRDLSCGIRLAFTGLRNTVSVFRALCTLTRIETSRLGGTGAGFGELAAEVMPLSEGIQASGEGVLEASAQLDQGVRSAIRSGSELRVRQLKDLPGLIAGVTDSLKRFEERRQRAAESSARQAAGYEAVCSAVDGMVQSVQFHDITRQQIEHVVEALRQLRAERESGNREPLRPEARAILALQASQLSGAAEVFAASVGRLDQDLSSIAARVLDMAEASGTLMGMSANDQESFFQQMEGLFTAILTMLSTCTTEQDEMASTAAGLEETIGRMRASVAEIREIEIRIQRIAINATIRATHIGDAGNALNLIAEIMQRLASDSNTNTESAGATLESMSDAAGRVSGHAATGAYSGTKKVTDEMRRAVCELHSSSECSFIRVHQIASAGASLVSDIGAVRDGFSAGPLFAEVAERARGELENICAQAGGGSGVGAEAVPSHQLEGLAKRYTMQRERDVHESMIRGSAPRVALDPTPAPRVALGEGDLGANVELF